MGKSTSWRLVTTLFLVVCLIITQFELDVFATTAGNNFGISPVGSRAGILDGHQAAPGAAVDFRLTDVSTSNTADGIIQINSSEQTSSVSVPDNASQEIIVDDLVFPAGATSAAFLTQSNQGVTQTNQTTTNRPGRNIWKWVVLIGVAAAATVLILLKGDEPVVTVGAPTVGNPQ